MVKCPMCKKEVEALFEMSITRNGKEIIRKVCLECNVKMRYMLGYLGVTELRQNSAIDEVIKQRGLDKLPQRERDELLFPEEKTP